MIGLGHTLIQHAPDSSFPSDHLSLLWAVSFTFLIRGHLRILGFALAVMGLLMAWARIYLGVHFPLDILGSMIVAAIAAGFCNYSARWFVTPMTRRLGAPYAFLFAPLIRRGWVLK